MDYQSTVQSKRNNSMSIDIERILEEIKILPELVKEQICLQGAIDNNDPYLGCNGLRDILNKGYKETDKIKTDGVERMIFRNISENDMVDLLAKEGGLRSVLLTPNKHL